MQSVAILTPVLGFTQFQPVLVGSGGFVEIINSTNYVLQILIGNQGEVFHADRTQAIYKLASDIQGQQTIQIATAGTPGGVATGGSGTDALSQKFNYNPLISGDNIEYPQKSKIFVNTYQQNEIEWYPPFGLSSPVLDTVIRQYAITQAFQGTDGGNGTIPLLAAPYPFVNSYLVLTGFDLSINSNGTGIIGSQFNIQGTQVTNNSPPLRWFVDSYHVGSVPEKFMLTRSWDPPLIGYPNGSLIFAMETALNGASWLLNVYYYGMYN